eukprot:COSAG06_NODE_4384_length_4313_cov_1.652112_2_plen_272_part_00
MIETPDHSDEESDIDPWAREANRLAKRSKVRRHKPQDTNMRLFSHITRTNPRSFCQDRLVTKRRKNSTKEWRVFSLNQKANLVGRPPVPTEAYLNRHNAVLDSSELTLSKLVAKVLRLEKLGKLALSSLNAVRAEQADKDETDRHMEVGEERDAQVKNILRSLEKFEAVCSMIHTATSAKACEPLVKQVRNKKKRRNTASPIELSTINYLSTINHRLPDKTNAVSFVPVPVAVSFRNISHAASGGLCASARPRRRDPRPDQAARPRPHQPR